MIVHIGTDHAGFELKNRLVAALRSKGHEVTDHGAHEYDALDDYPPFCTAVGEAVVAQPGSFGVVIGGSGNGEQIAANKVAGVRAALASSPELAALARQHNDARIVSIGARFTDVATAQEIVRAFLTTEFEDEERHARRAAMLEAYEADGTLPA